MRYLAGTCILVVALAHAPIGIAQDANANGIGRWVKQGTYALSGFAVNPERERTYRGAEKERGRLLSYLPAMTVVFPGGLLDGTPALAGYVPGITQSGTPVMVLERELSRAKFGSQDTHDVVIHARHDACPEPHCDLTTDGRPVGAGQSYKIADGTAEDLVHLTNPGSETDFYYRTDQFRQLERRGTLTRMRDRAIPPWDIREGYAKELSVGCGGQHPPGTKFTADSEAYERSPSEWALNDPQWTVKAADLFVGSEVEKIGGIYTAEVTSLIHDVSKTSEHDDNYKSAIDFTVFAYRDRNTPGSGYQFAVLISVVACTRPIMGEFTPDYVREAHLFFEDQSYALPQQIGEEGKKLLSIKISRSFMYSVNTSDQYEQLFNRLADGLSVNESDVRSNLVAVVIARLNATCERERRPTCARIVDSQTIRADVARR
ncbi:hypothetical protein GOD90_20295 [Sinorhizobium medicae]|nr:hypothetical protein [Sinorhizobium medicae]MDX0899296.1 hypothetical protein [Sinorhizobium medicae]MDX1120222.1 hypothetical protein [Sinorhizobium medicae]MDX1242705.1 hypothetical protein [Sinorhizobium medicae]